MNTFMIVIGWIASIFSVVVFMPQAVKTIKLKSAEGLSKITFTWLYVVYIIFVIWAPFVMIWQAFATNAILIFVGFPIVYYMFKDKKIILFLLSTLGLSAILVSLLEFLVWKPSNEIIESILSMFAGIIIGIIFFPQTLKVIKNKNIGTVSIKASILIPLSNSLWIFFYIAKLSGEFNLSVLIQLIACFFGIVMQLPMIYYYFIEKKHNK